MKIVYRVVFIIFIVVVGLYFAVYALASQSEDSWFNSNYRSKIAQYPLTRSLFYLNWDGDARADYLKSSPYSSLRIEIDRYDDCLLSEEMLVEIEDEIKKIIQKPNGIIFSEENSYSLSKDQYSYEEIISVMEKYGTSRSGDPESVIHLICINRYADDPTNIGVTLEEDGIAIFWQTIKELSRNNPESLKPFVVSTILHEIGHQVGMRHIDNEQCVMAPFVEKPGNAKGALRKIPTSFCEEEINMVEELRNSL